MGGLRHFLYEPIRNQNQHTLRTVQQTPSRTATLVNTSGSILEQRLTVGKGDTYSGISTFRVGRAVGRPDFENENSVCSTIWLSRTYCTDLLDRRITIGCRESPCSLICSGLIVRAVLALILVRSLQATCETKV